MGKRHKHLYEFGRFSLDASNRLLLRDGEPVPLHPKAFDTLLLLVEHRGEVLGKDELMQALWPDSFVEESNLSQNIYVLRKALGQEANSEEYIKTLPKRGYRFAADVWETGEESGDLILEEHVRSRVVVDERIETGYNVRSIAVLPFKILTHDVGDEYLGLGMADALITRLSNIKQILVRPTSAVLKYGVSDRDPVEIGRELRVDAVLDGSIWKRYERIRATVQLVSVRDEAPTWAEKFDEDFTDIFAVEDSISEQVVRALLLKLTGDEQMLLTKHFTENVEAYRLYLKGRYFWNRRTGEATQKALKYFEQSIDVDAGYAWAYVGVADCYNLLSDLMVLPPKEAFPKATTAALNALEIDDTLAEAHASLAYVLWSFDWDLASAEREFKRATELNRNYATAHHWYGNLLAVLGQFDQAITALRRAQELDPFSLIINADLGQVFYFARQYDRAVGQLQDTIELDSNFYMTHLYLGQAYAQQGDLLKASRELQKARLLDDDPKILQALAYTYAVFGKGEEARELIEELNGLSRQRYVDPYFTAMIYAGFRENDQAFALLQKACEDRTGWVTNLKVEPMADVLRSDPRLIELLKRVGLTP